MKKIIEIHPSYPVMEGAGVRVFRVIGNPYIDSVDPVPLLDEFRSSNPNDYIKGFPTHPHRGIQTVTYMKKGQIEHKDSKGNQGVIGANSVQWMTAGRGILHSEMPQKSSGELWGYQLWLSLLKEDKMVEPGYEQIEAEDLPLVNHGGVTVRVIAGEFEGRHGPKHRHFDGYLLDIMAEHEEIVTLPISNHGNHFFYVYEGGMSVCNQWIDPKHLVVIEADEAIHIKLPNDSGCIYFSGLPNNEPMVKGGPFVMNTKKEIIEAFDDYQKGLIGE
jgi:redox-sensitive bicupin YhaK (pirin superfamily)